MKRIYVGAIVLLVVVIAAVWWKMARRGCKASADCGAGVACSEGKCVSMLAAPPAGVATPPAGVAAPPGGACTPQRLSRIRMMDTSANVAGVGQAIVKPSECESDPEGKWLLFQLADTAGNVGSLLGTLGTSSASDCAKACADNASCTAWVASGRGCNLWSQPPELVVGAMGSTVGIRAAAL